MIEIQGCINFGLIKKNFHTLAIIIFKQKHWDLFYLYKKNSVDNMVPNQLQ